jgi:hypothetical protein
VPAKTTPSASISTDFDRKIKLEFHGSSVTSDAGLLAYRELDDALRLAFLCGRTAVDLRRAWLRRESRAPPGTTTRRETKSVAVK